METLEYPLDSFAVLEKCGPLFAVWLLKLTCFEGDEYKAPKQRGGGAKSMCGNGLLSLTRERPEGPLCRTMY